MNANERIKKRQFSQKGIIGVDRRASAVNWHCGQVQRFWRSGFRPAGQSSAQIISLEIPGRGAFVRVGLALPLQGATRAVVEAELKGGAHEAGSWLKNTPVHFVRKKTHTRVPPRSSLRVLGLCRPLNKMKLSKSY